MNAITRLFSKLLRLVQLLLLTVGLYLKWCCILLTWPVSVPVLLIMRSNRRHAELMAAVQRSQR